MKSRIGSVGSSRKKGRPASTFGLYIAVADWRYVIANAQDRLSAGSGFEAAGQNLFAKSGEFRTAQRL